jgi:hypothetical protein
VSFGCVRRFATSSGGSVTSLAQEYQQVLKSIKSLDAGDKILSSIASFARSATSSLFRAVHDGEHQDTAPFFLPTIERVRESTTARVALSWMGERTVSELFEKNFTLLFGRILRAAACIDAASRDDKLLMFVDLVLLLSSSVQNWVVEKQKQLAPTPHKKERRQRRQLSKNSSEIPQELINACSLTCEHLKAILLPQGIESLFLPSGSRFFSHWIVDIPDKIMETFSEWVCRNVFTRSNKAHLVSFIYSWCYQHFVIANLDIRISDIVPAKELSEKLAPAITPILKLLAPPAARSFLSFLPKEDIASKLLQCVSSHLDVLSIEKTFATSVHCIFSMNEKNPDYEDELRCSIDAIAHDDRTVRAFFKALLPRSLTPGAFFGETPSVLSLFCRGMQAAAQQEVIQSILDNTDWQNEVAAVLQHFWWFMGSSHCDLFLCEALRRFISDRESSPR